MNIADELFITSNSDLYRNATSNNPWTAFLNYIYISVYGINFAVGLPINSYVLWLIVMGKGSGVVSEFFSLNLTFCEMLFCFGGLCFILSFAFPKFLLITIFMGGIPIASRPLFLCLICVERYIAVIYPVTFLKYKPPRYRLACSGVVWMVVLGFCVLFVFIIFSDNMYALLCIILPLYSLLFFIKLFCCLAVVRALKHPGPGQKGKERDEANQVKRKAATVILIITVATVSQYSPVLVAGILFGVLIRAQFYMLWAISTGIALLVGYVHAFLYIYKTG